MHTSCQACRWAFQFLTSMTEGSTLTKRLASLCERFAALECNGDNKVAN